MNGVHVATIHNGKSGENKSTIPSLSLDLDALYESNALNFLPMDGYRSWLFGPTGMVLVWASMQTYTRWTIKN